VFSRRSSKQDRLEALARHVGTRSSAGSCSSASARGICEVCKLPAFPPTAIASLAPLVLIYLCRHIVHAACALPDGDVELPTRAEHASISYLLSSDNRRSVKFQTRGLGSKLSYSAAVRVRAGGCPVCSHNRGRATGRATAFTVCATA
jgi:hypothetical protein